MPTPTLRRLPVYHRILQELFLRGTRRISSGRLSGLTGFTASQIRQDISFIGSFGQQGYGYNVEALYNALNTALKASEPLKAILIGAGNLGRAISGYLSNQHSGVSLIGVFDKNEAMSGRLINGIPIRNMSVIEEFCLENSPSVAVLCIPASSALQTAQQLSDFGIKGILNFTGTNLKYRIQNTVIEDVSFSDSILALRFYLD